MGKMIIGVDDELLLEINLKVSEIYTICSEESTCKIRVSLRC